VRQSRNNFDWKMMLLWWCLKWRTDLALGSVSLLKIHTFPRVEECVIWRVRKTSI
jgi:hypothetical protein